MEQEDFPTAVRHLGNAAALLPRNLEYRCWLAGALIQNGQADESLPHLEVILDHNPQDLVAALRLCQVLSNLNRWEESETWARRSVSLAIPGYGQHGVSADGRGSGR